MCSRTIRGGRNVLIFFRRPWFPTSICSCVLRAQRLRPETSIQPSQLEHTRPANNAAHSLGACILWVVSGDFSLLRMLEREDRHQRRKIYPNSCHLLRSQFTCRRTPHNTGGRQYTSVELLQSVSEHYRWRTGHPSRLFALNLLLDHL